MSEVVLKLFALILFEVELDSAVNILWEMILNWCGELLNWMLDLSLTQLSQPQGNWWKDLPEWSGFAWLR